MNELQKKHMYRLRRVIGWLGLVLPISLVLTDSLMVGEFRVLSSISHYYYSAGSIFFTGTLILFGVLLGAYQGYPNPQSSDQRAIRFLSDRSLTAISSISAFMTMLIPTQCDGSGHDFSFCCEGVGLVEPFLLGRSGNEFSDFHFLAAALFLASLALICMSQFTRSASMEGKFWRPVYQFLGWVVVGCLLALAALFFFIFPKDSPLIDSHGGIVFWLESVALWAFSIAWLIKGSKKWRQKSFPVLWRFLSPTRVPRF